jgi:hypothetical protein
VVSGRCTPSITLKAHIGKRSREWTAVGETDVDLKGSVAFTLFLPLRGPSILASV